MLATLQQLVADDSAADDLSPDERDLALKCCDQLKTMLSAAHLLNRNLRRSQRVAAQRAAVQGATLFPPWLLLDDYRDMIFSFLAVRDLGSATAACKDWSSETAWQVAYHNRWGCDEKDLVGKFAYALRDACESRDPTEAKLLAEAETERVMDEWVYCRAMWHPDAGLVKSNENKEARVKNSYDFRMAAIERVRAGLLSEACSTTIDSAQAILDLLERGFDVQHEFSMSAIIPEMKGEEGGCLSENQECVRFTLTSNSGCMTYFTFCVEEHPGQHYGDADEGRTMHLRAYELGVPAPDMYRDKDKGWTLKNLRGALHGEDVSNQGAPLWSTHQYRQNYHVRSQEPSYVSTTGIWPVVLLRSERAGWKHETEYECDDFARIESLLEGSLGLDPEVVRRDDLLLTFALLLDLGTVELWNTGAFPRYSSHESPLQHFFKEGGKETELERFSWTEANAKETTLSVETCRKTGTKTYHVWSCSCCGSKCGKSDEKE